jgi:hypothetical protein
MYMQTNSKLPTSSIHQKNCSSLPWASLECLGISCNNEQWKTVRTFNLLTHSLTPYSTVFLEKLTGLQQINKFPTFYGTQRLITTFTIACQLSLSLASSIQSIPPHPEDPP